jgi:prefoldin subunit 2
MGTPLEPYISRDFYASEEYCSSSTNTYHAMPPKASTSTAATATPAKLSPQEVPAVFQRYRTELQNLAQKIGELESELEEHT